jgi:predicted ABC-type ATPase
LAAKHRTSQRACSNQGVRRGHNIEPQVIERRYYKGIKNLFDIYLPIVDGAFIFDNSLGKHQLLAQKLVNGQLTIINENKFNELKIYYDHS